ncbi:MAG: hypothetical protein AAB928_01950, partial [Patescibacteria group bacterium]
DIYFDIIAFFATLSKLDFLLRNELLLSDFGEVYLIKIGWGKMLLPEERNSNSWSIHVVLKLAYGKWTWKILAVAGTGGSSGGSQCLAV